jgi:hypothetical protein
VHTTLDIYVFIAKIKIKIETLHIHSLICRTKLFFKEGLTWFEAQRCCASRFGQLATIDDTIVGCKNIPPWAETLWTGNIRRHSEWIEFQGKLNKMEIYTYAYFI